MAIDLEILKNNLTNDLKKSLVNSRVLLDKLKLIDEDSRKSGAYLDPTYSGFYYHLGKYVEAKNVMEIGFNLGLLSSCFFLSCKLTENFVGYNKNYAHRIVAKMGRANVKMRFKGNIDVYCGDLFDKELDDIIGSKKFDLVLINDEVSFDDHLKYLDFAWGLLEEDGLIVQDYLAKHSLGNSAFSSFASSKSRKILNLATRYGVGILQK